MTTMLSIPVLEYLMFNVMLADKCYTYISINQSSIIGGIRQGVRRQPFDVSSNVNPVQVSMQAPFPYQVLTPNRKHRLAPAMNFVGAPLTSSTPGYLFQRQTKRQDQLLGNVPHTHIAGVDVGGLRW